MAKSKPEVLNVNSKITFLMIVALVMFALPSFADEHERGTKWELSAGIGGAFEDVDSNVQGLEVEHGANWNAAITAYPSRFSREAWAIGLETQVERSLGDSGFDMYRGRRSFGTLRTTAATVSAKLRLPAMAVKGYTPFIRVGYGLVNAETAGDSDFGNAGRFGAGVERMISDRFGFAVSADYVLTDASPSLFRGSSATVSPDYTGLNLNLFWKAN